MDTCFILNFGYNNALLLFLLLLLPLLLWPGAMKANSTPFTSQLNYIDCCLCYGSLGFSSEWKRRKRRRRKRSEDSFLRCLSAFSGIPSPKFRFGQPVSFLWLKRRLSG